MRTRLLVFQGLPPGGEPLIICEPVARVYRMFDVRLDHSVIHVSDWEISNRFYRDVLGAEIVQPAEGRYAYRFGDQQLNVHGPGVDVGTLVARRPVEPGNSDLCFVWPDPIEGAVEHLRSFNIAIEAGPVARDGAGGAGISIYFRDPDGSLLEFISYTTASGRSTNDTSRVHSQK